MANILYVEDEASLGKIVSESLKSRAFAVHWVQDGRKALPIFLQDSFDLCVLDVMLPGKNGFDIGKEIRKHRPGIPIIYLTAKTQTQDVVAGFQAGGNDYIRKPFSLEELILRIENLLKLSGNALAANQTPSLEAAYSLGRYHYVPHKFELAYEGEVRRLSHREAQVLHLFLQHPNQVVSRKKILTAVWGDDSFFNSRTLDVYIKKLRDYLKRDSDIHIITLKGVGYQFVWETSK